MNTKHDDAFILWFDEIGIIDVPLVGGKNASLGEMYMKLLSKGIANHCGFAWAFRKMFLAIVAHILRMTIECLTVSSLLGLLFPLLENEFP